MDMKICLYHIQHSKEIIMNEMIMKLNALVDESLNLINNVKEETKRLECIDMKNKIVLYDDFCRQMIPYFDIVKKLPSFDRYIKVSDNFYIKFGLPAIVINICSTSDSRLGYVDLRDQYKANANRLFTSYKNYNGELVNDLLEYFIRDFDWNMFDNNFSIAVVEELAKEAEKVNINYQIINEKVNE